MLQQEGRDASCRWVCLPVCTASDSQHSSTSRFSPDDVFTSLLSGSSSQLRAERRGRLLPTACLPVLCCRGAALRVAVRVVTNHTGGFDRVLDQHACLPGASEETSLTHCFQCVSSTTCSIHRRAACPECNSMIGLVQAGRGKSVQLARLLTADCFLDQDPSTACRA